MNTSGTSVKLQLSYPFVAFVIDDQGWQGQKAKSLRNHPKFHFSKITIVTVHVVLTKLVFNFT